MIINKKIKRTMMESKSQYVGSLLLIIISCMLFTMFNLLSKNMTRITTSFERDYTQEDANFVTDKKLNLISDLESKFNMKIEEGSVLDYSVSQDKTLRIFRENTKVNKPAIIQGKNLNNHEILLDPSYAKSNKLKIGDSIKVYNNSFKISGFMSLPNYIYTLKSENDLMNDPNKFGVAVISKENFENLNEGSTFYSIRFNGAGNSKDNSINRFKDYLKSVNINILKWTDASENPRITFVSAKLEGINKMSTSMPVMILLLTCILTSVVVWRMLKREAKSIGTLYALGYRKREIMNHYILYPLSVALTGGIIGTVLGAITLRPMLQMMLSYFNMPLDYIGFNSAYVVLSVLLPVIFLTVCSWFVINKELKYAPVELMRGGKETSKVNFLERHLKLDGLRFSTKFKIREQLRSLSRSVFLLLGVILSTMLLLLGFAAKSSLGFMLNDSYQGTFKYNYYYLFNTIKQGNPQEGEPFSVSVFLPESGNKISFEVYGIDPKSQYIYLKDKAGNKISNDKIIISKPLAETLKIRPKDKIEIINKLDSKKYSITIDNIAETYAGQYIYMPIKQFNSLMNYPENSYMGLWSKNKINIPQNELLSTATIDDLKNAFNASIKPMQYIVGTMSFIAFVIGLIVIYVVTSLVIEENRENISLMKVLGYRKKEVYSLILNSSSFMVVLGYILGVPLLLASLSALFKSITKSMNFVFPVTINYVYILIGFIIVYATYEISKALSKRKVNKISMTEALKTGME